MPVENILSHFWELASLDENVRLKAASQLLCALEQAQKQHRQNIQDGEEEINCSKELEYSVTRLVKGLASSRKGARQGFATVLTEILSTLECPSPDRVFRLIAQNLEVTGSCKAWEEKDAYVGEIFGLMALLRSQCGRKSLSSQNAEWLGPLIARIQELSTKKSYLQELCAKAIVDVFGLVSTDVFIQCVYPAVKGIIESGWAQATPEILLVSLAVQRLWGDHIDKKVMEDAWKCSLIADKRNYKQLATVLLDSIAAHPRVHCVWDEMFLTLFDNPASDFKLFWKTVVEDELFESTHERKFLGFHLVEKILSQVSADEVPVLFSGHMMRSFINSLSSPQAYLHKAAKHLASSLPAAIKKNTDTDIAAVVLKQLLGRHGSIEFDKLTKTRTVDNVAGALKGSGVNKFVSWLLDVFTKGFVEDSSEPLLSKNVESLRTSVLNQLLALVKNKSVSREGQWIEEVLFLFEHAYFQPITSHLQVAMTPAVKRICEQRFVSLLKELLSGKVKEVKEDKLYGIVHYAKGLLEDKSYQVALDSWTIEAEKAFRKAVKVITKIQKKTKNTGTIHDEEDVFGVLFSLMALHLFSDQEQARDILKELKVCYERQKVGNNEENADDPHWVEVLTEVLLSLLTRPSSLFRLVADYAFSVLAPHLTRNALNIILESLDPRKGDNGETLEIVDESGEEEESDMEVDETSGKKQGRLNNSSENGNDHDSEGDDDDDDDDDDVDDEEDDEQDANGVVDEAFRAEVQAALGPAVVHLDNEGSSSDEDLDDEAMMKLNDALAVAFKTHLKAKKDKNKKKDAMKILLHFKLRALDIVEIFIKKQGSNPLILEIIDPLLDVVWSSLNSKDFNMLGERAQSLFKNKLCPAKELPPASAVNAKDVHRKIEHLIKKAMRAPSVGIVSLVTRGCLYLVRVLRGSQINELAAAKKRAYSGNVELDASTQISLLDGPRIAKAFKKALKNFMLKRSSHLHPVLFTELIGRFPHLGWPLAEDLVTYLETAVNNFRKTQACLMLMQLLSNRIPDHPRHVREIALPMQTTLSRLLTRAAESDTELKVKNIREILRLTNKFVNEASSADQTTAVLQTDVLKESLSAVLSSPLAKRSPDIKRSCNAILTALSRSDDEHHQTPKTKKKRQLADGQGCPESASIKDESEDHQTNVGNRKEKKKKVVKKEEF